MCGLKQKCQYYHQNRQYVTPHVGVWIETDMRTKEVPRDSVTPHVGVWIETQSGILKRTRLMSHLM